MKISGSASLIEALVKESGIVLAPSRSKVRTSLITDEYDNFKYGTNTASVDFNLPQDWDNALTYLKLPFAPIDVRTLKKGDLVVVLPIDTWYTNAKQGEVQAVCEISDNGEVTLENGRWYTKMRRATEDEIERFVSLPEYIKEWKLNQRDSTTIGYGCKQFTKEEIESILDMMELLGRLEDYEVELTPKGITIAGTTLNAIQLRHLANKITKE